MILADYTLPDFDGLRALHLLKQSGREIPFIIVSGTIGEELAVRAIKEGAADYLLKDRLARLGAAVSHALEQRLLREEHQHAQENLRARQEAERANAAKSEFLSRMSHELRTPLNAILGFGQLLESDDLSKSQAESVYHILGAGRHLLHLVNEVLDISNVESGNLSTHCEEVDLHALLQKTVMLIRPLAAQRQVAVCLGEPPQEPFHLPGVYVTADPQRLRQVLLNLLSNAVKYNKVGGKVTLDYRSGVGKLRLRVADTGPGIAADKVSRLFVPFDRLGVENRGIEGTGLGLTLSKGLMEAMGGTLGLECPPQFHGEGESSQAGAVFWIELPWVATPSLLSRRGDAPSRLLACEA